MMIKKWMVSGFLFANAVILPVQSAQAVTLSKEVWNWMPSTVLSYHLERDTWGVIWCACKEIATEAKNSLKNKCSSLYNAYGAKDVLIAYQIEALELLQEIDELVMAVDYHFKKPISSSFDTNAMQRLYDLASNLKKTALQVKEERLVEKYEHKSAKKIIQWIDSDLRWACKWNDYCSGNRRAFFKAAKRVIGANKDKIQNAYPVVITDLLGSVNACIALNGKSPDTQAIESFCTMRKKIKEALHWKEIAGYAAEEIKKNVHSIKWHLGRMEGELEKYHLKKLALIKKGLDIKVAAWWNHFKKPVQEGDAILELRSALCAYLENPHDVAAKQRLTQAANDKHFELFDGETSFSEGLVALGALTGFYAVVFGALWVLSASKDFFFMQYGVDGGGDMCTPFQYFVIEKGSAAARLLLIAAKKRVIG